MEELRQVHAIYEAGNYVLALQMYEDMIKNPKTFSNFRVTPEQLQNTIDDWSAPKPIDAFYKRIFGMTFAEKKAQEEIQNMILEKKDKDDKKKEKEKVTIQ